MSIIQGTKINQLLFKSTSSGLLFAEWLRENGYSGQLQKRYRDSGWLTGMCKGVMYRTGSKLNAYDAVASFNQQMNGKLRIAAMSALEYAGFNHYVPMGKPILMVALPSNVKQPLWTKKDLYDMTFRTFHANVFTKIEEVIRHIDSGVLHISSPEQAFMECLLLAPKLYSYMDLYYVMEQLGTLRADVVQGLLEKTDNNRIKRMFLYMAEKAGHYWFDELQMNKIELGTGKMQLVANGIFNKKYMITIPKELEEYEG